MEPVERYPKYEEAERSVQSVQEMVRLSVASAVVMVGVSVTAPSAASAMEEV